MMFLFEERETVNLFWSLSNIWRSTDKEYCIRATQSEQELLKCHVWPMSHNHLVVRDNK